MNFRISHSLLLSSSLFLTLPAAAVPFGTSLSFNNTGFSDSLFLGAPDGSSSDPAGTNWVGIGTGIVEYDFGTSLLTSGSGGDIDFVVYEVDFGTSEFDSVEVTVSLDGISYSAPLVDIPGIDIAGDSGRGSGGYAVGYDISGFSTQARYVRLSGTTGGSPGGTNGFDLDAIGLVNYQISGDGDPLPLPPTLLLFAFGGLGLGWKIRAGYAK